MKKTAMVMVIMMMAVVIFAFATGCSADTADTTTTTTTTTSAETTTETTTGLKYEDLPDATTTTTAPDYTEELEEIYENLGVDHVTGMAFPQIVDNQLIIKSHPSYGDVGGICPTKEYLEAHDFEFFGNEVEKYEPTVFADGEHVEGPRVAIFESDPEHVGIRWKGQLKIIIDSKYVVIIDPS